MPTVSSQCSYLLLLATLNMMWHFAHLNKVTSWNVYILYMEQKINVHGAWPTSPCVAYTWDDSCWRWCHCHHCSSLTQLEPALSPLRVKSSGVRQSINLIIKQLNELTIKFALHPNVPYFIILLCLNTRWCYSSGAWINLFNNNGTPCHNKK
jgi:hypothetical protein